MNPQTPCVTPRPRRRYQGSAWLRRFLDPDRLAATIDLAAEALSHHTFDSIAFRGMSGALIAPALAVRLRKGMVMVRKDDASSHSSFSVEGNRLASRYIIVDDFVDSGSTRDQIIEAVGRFSLSRDVTCLGVLECTYLTPSRVAKARVRGTYPLHTHGIDVPQ